MKDFGGVKKVQPGFVADHVLAMEMELQKRIK